MLSGPDGGRGSTRRPGRNGSRPVAGEEHRAVAPEIRQTLTDDQGKGMALHKKLAKNTGLKIYFCDPHSPWQRGVNEHTNGLLRHGKQMDCLKQLESLGKITGRAGARNSLGRLIRYLRARSPTIGTTGAPA
jgi:hypothetical protein